MLERATKEFRGTHLPPGLRELRAMTRRRTMCCACRSVRATTILTGLPPMCRGCADWAQRHEPSRRPSVKNRPTRADADARLRMLLLAETDLN